MSEKYVARMTTEKREEVTALASKVRLRRRKSTPRRFC